MNFRNLVVNNKCELILHGYRSPDHFADAAVSAYDGILIRDEKSLWESTGNLWVPGRFIVTSSQVEDFVPGAVYRDANGVYWQLSDDGGYWHTLGSGVPFLFDTPQRPLEKMP